MMGRVCPPMQNSDDYSCCPFPQDQMRAMPEGRLAARVTRVAPKGGTPVTSTTGARAEEPKVHGKRKGRRGLDEIHERAAIRVLLFMQVPKLHWCQQMVESLYFFVQSMLGPCPSLWVRLRNVVATWRHHPCQIRHILHSHPFQLCITETLVDPDSLEPDGLQKVQLLGRACPRQAPRALI